MSEIIVPSSPKDLEAIEAKIKDLSNLKTMIDANNDTIKEGIEEMSKQYGIDKKYFNRMLKDYHKQQFENVSSEFDAYESLYESIFSR